jgi:hypothetical protein
LDLIVPEKLIPRKGCAMKKILLVSLVLAFFLVTFVPVAQAGGHGNYWGPAIIGGIVGGIFSGVIFPPRIYYDSQQYYYAPPPYYSPPVPMCLKTVETGYWAVDYYGQRHWISMGPKTGYFPCD